MRSAMWKTTFREIKNSLGRYLAILAIVALGVGFFVGLKITRPVMIATVEDFVENQNFYDFKLMSTLGFTDEDVKALQSLRDATSSPVSSVVAGAISIDVLYENGEAESVLKLHSITDGINDCYLTAGRMPEKADECVVDSRLMTAADIGTEIKIAADNDEDTLDMLVYESYKVVGIVQNPLYLNFERGTTSLGNGKLAGYAFIPEAGFDSEYYTEIYIKYNQDFELYSDAYEQFIESNEDFVDTVVSQRVDIRYETLLDEANDKLADGEQELADAKKELADNEQKLSDARQDVADGEQELVDAEDEITKGEKKLADARKQLEKGKAELLKKKNEAEKEFAAAKKKIEDAEKTIKKNEKALEAGEKQLAEGETTLANSEKELQTQKTDLEAKKQQIEAGLLKLAEQRAALGDQVVYYEEALAAEEAKLKQSLAQVEAGLKELAAGEKELAEAKKEITKQRKELAKARQEIEKGKQELETARKEYEKNYAAYEKEIKKAEKELSAAEEKIKDGEAELADARKKVNNGKTELADAKQELADAEEKLTDGKLQLSDAEEELADARKEIGDIPKPQHYVLGRDSNAGYVCFESDSMIVDNIADVFPVFFFLVALLVCITTMNRMVDEGRTQIGVLKALGYSRTAIMGEYIFYSGSSALLGGMIGFAIGSTVFPYIIWQTYGIMYEVCGTHFVFSWRAVLFSALVSLLCSVGATMLSCYVEFASVPANLMRPKAPKSGKRVFLEYVKPIWSHLSFLRKVSVRNVLRYKKRFLMMVLGISGCTALLVTGYGLKDSIVNIAENQYDRIQTYDLDVILSDAADEEQMALLREDFAEDMTDSLFMHSDTVDLVSGTLTKQVTLVVPEAVEKVDAFWHLYSPDGDAISYPQKSEAVITEKIAKKLQLSIGDTLTVRNDAMQSMTVTITGIAENYVYNYLYISSETYEQGFGEVPEYKQVCVQTPDEKDVHEIAAAFAEDEDVLQITVTADLRARLSNMMDSLDAVVVLVIVSAGALAFIVLYNLTNINIMERIREIATIKVLGFYSGETAQYVFRENMILTAIGAFVGLFLGKWLHGFVMYNIDIDLVSFDVHISLASYVVSVVLTFVFSLLVDVVMYFKLEKINMAESLKSIE